MESCGMNIIKYILFVFNLIFSISGIIIIVTGVFVLGSAGNYGHFVETRVMAPPFVLIIAGVIVFIIAFLGCYGAVAERYNVLIAFVVALLIICIIELAVGIAAAVFRQDFNVAMKDSLMQSMKNYSDADKKAWDDMQTKLACCGVTGPNDWSPDNGFTGTFPQSCCSEMKESCQIGSPYLYEDGCMSMLETSVRKGATILIGVGLGIAIVEVVGMVLACCLATAIKRENEK